jgi:intracellular multiplication protein IcmL
VATSNTNTAKTVKKQTAAELVALRNRFFYVSYRKLSLIFVAAFALCAFSLVSAFYFAGRKTPPVYVPISPSGQVVPTYPLNQPSSADPEVMNALVAQWSLEGARRAFSYDYLNYTEQVNTAQSYFTYRGWENFVKSLGQSQNFNTVQQQKMIVKFTPKSAPIITASQVRDGRLAWAIQFDGTIQYVAHDGHQGFLQNVLVKMVVVRMSTVDSPKGLGIDQVVVDEIVAK